MQTELFDGVCEGRIIFAPRGQNGFGYDPLFVPDGFEQTFAELGDEVKNKLSHRAKALQKLQNISAVLAEGRSEHVSRPYFLSRKKRLPPVVLLVTTL